MDIDSTVLSNYKAYLNKIEDLLLNKYFEAQKDYLSCAKGCSHCCERGQYPITEIELQYMMLGMGLLPDSDKNIINKKINTLKTEADSTKKDEFMYACPFLINSSCSIYEYRPLICRTHGLMFYIKNAEKTRYCMPNCVYLGLNYSTVYDFEQKMISEELWKKTQIKTEPVAYNISLSALTDKKTTEAIGLNFGEFKPLIYWFL